jgi:hypothetical protein
MARRQKHKPSSNVVGDSLDERQAEKLAKKMRKHAKNNQAAAVPNGSGQWHVVLGAVPKGSRRQASY